MLYALNAQIDSLARENRILRETIEKMKADPGDIPFDACDNSCVVATAYGMATNGGCRCDERKLRRATQWWRRRAEFLQVTVQELKNELAIERNRAEEALIKLENIEVKK